MYASQHVHSLLKKMLDRPDLSYILNNIHLSLFSSPIRRIWGAYAVTPVSAASALALVLALALALASALPAWLNLCMQGLFSDTMYAIALKLHTLIKGH